MLERAREGWPEDDTVVEKWKVMRAALVDTALETLGRVRRSQPDWFRESEDIIRPYLQERNVAYTKWLANTNRQYLVKFREARSRARQAVRRVKNEWFRRKEKEAKRKHFRGKEVCQCIRDLQRGRRGRMAVRVNVDDEDDKPCVTTTNSRPGGGDILAGCSMF